MNTLLEQKKHILFRALTFKIIYILFCFISYQPSKSEQSAYLYGTEQ